LISLKTTRDQIQWGTSENQERENNCEGWNRPPKGTRFGAREDDIRHTFGRRRATLRHCPSRKKTESRKDDPDSPYSSDCLPSRRRKKSEPQICEGEIVRGQSLVQTREGRKGHFVTVQSMRFVGRGKFNDCPSLCRREH